MTSAAAPTPTARPATPGPGTAPARVVVGVDGSPASQRALLFAAGEAQLRSAVLCIVAACDASRAGYGYAAGLSSGWDLGPLQDRLREAAQALVKAAADTVAVELAGPPVHVRTQVVQGRPSQALLEAAHDAVLLVVGARGSGALTRLLLGSTSSEVVHAARLPVVVVPPAEDKAAEDRAAEDQAAHGQAAEGQAVQGHGGTR